MEARNHMSRKMNDIYSGRQLSNLKGCSTSENKLSCYISFGQNYLGPFLYAYISWLYDEIAKEGISKIFFLARDGYLMEKAFRILQDKKHTDMDAKYAYFSRRSIRQALFWNCDSYRQSLQLQFLPKNARYYITMEGILEYWGFSFDESRDIAKEFHLDLKEEFLAGDLYKNTKLEKLFQKLQYKIKENSKQQSKLLSSYFEQIGMREYCAIVDIGWEGRMQQYLELFAENERIPLSCTGYYLGMQATVPVKGKLEGFLYNDAQPKLRKSVLVARGLYEKFFQSSEGSTLSYREENGTIVPVLGKYEYENQPDLCNRIHILQNASLEYLRDAVENNFPVSVALTKPLVHIAKYPSLKDIQLFSFLYNEEDKDGKKDYFLSQKNLFHYSPKELAHDLINSSWKTGFMKSVFKVPFPYYLIYCIIKK